MIQGSFDIIRPRHYVQNKIRSIATAPDLGLGRLSSCQGPPQKQFFLNMAVSYSVCHRGLLVNVCMFYFNCFILKSMDKICHAQDREKMLANLGSGHTNYLSSTIIVKSLYNSWESVYWMRSCLASNVPGTIQLRLIRGAR